MNDTERIDISQHTNAICELLGLEPAFVKELVITPSAATATVYRKNENGSKFIVDGAAPVDHHNYEVRT